MSTLWTPVLVDRHVPPTCPRYTGLARHRKPGCALGGPLLEIFRQLLLLPAFLFVAAGAVTAAAFVPMLADRGRPARPGRKELGTWARESFAKAINWILSPLTQDMGRPRRGSGNGVAVLLVPDAGNGRWSMFGMSRFLLRRGHRSVLIAPSGRGTLEARAQRLAKAAKRWRSKHQLESIAIVGHGTGGLVAGWYVSHLAPTQLVERVVSIGTPWSGSRMAAFAFGPIARETLPGAPILDGLPPPSHRLVCLWGSLDPMVLPAASAVVPGATEVKLSGAGHLDMLFSARTFRAVAEALATPVSEPPVQDEE